MKRILLTIATLVIALVTNAQSVTFKLSDGVSNATLKSKVEQNTSQLLSEINAAQKEERAINFSGLDLSSSASEAIAMLWKNITFKPTDQVIVERLLETSNGYQVRNIPLEITSTNPSPSLVEESYQEAVIDFNANGTIQSFYFAISNNLYLQVMNSTNGVTDLRRRQLILDYVEHFRTAYNQKDIKFLQQVFSDDAIIITGKVITTKPSEVNLMPQKQITYKSQNKSEYLSRLSQVFRNNRNINVKFSEIKVARHGSLEGYYGVLLRQGYSSDTYSDDGYVFLLWDFRNADQPQIHVRTWQPYYLDSAQSQVISESEIFDISSFDL